MMAWMRMRWQRQAQRPARNERGVVLILTYLSVSLFLTLGAAYLDRVVSNMQTAQRYLHGQVGAFHYSEAGLHRAIVELRNNPVFEGTLRETFPPTLDDAMPGPPPVGGYLVNVTIVHDKHGDPTDQRHVTSWGAYNEPVNAQILLNNAASRQQLFSIVTVQPKIEHWALFVDHTIDGSGGAGGTGWNVDSYDSRNGPYGPGNRRGAKGNIGTNSPAAGAINLAPFVGTLNGADFVCGPNCVPPNVILSGMITYDEKKAADETRQLTPPSTGLESEGDLIIAPNTTHVLSAGEHRFSTIAVGAGATLTSDGPVVIYVDDGMTGNPNAQIKAQSLIPGDMAINLLPGAGVSMLGVNIVIYGKIYAPTNVLNIASTGFILYGSLTAQAVAVDGDGVGTGLTIHYDEALGQIENTVTNKAWLWKDAVPTLPLDDHI